MVRNTDRTGLRNWGHGPALTEGIPARLEITNPNIKHVWALDSSGSRAQELPVTQDGNVVTFTIGPEYRTVWYEIAEQPREVAIGIPTSAWISPTPTCPPWHYNDNFDR